MSDILNSQSSLYDNVYLSGLNNNKGTNIFEMLWVGSFLQKAVHLSLKLYFMLKCKKII